MVRGVACTPVIYLDWADNVIIDKEPGREDGECTVLAEIFLFFLSLSMNLFLMLFVIVFCP